MHLIPPVLFAVHIPDGVLAPSVLIGGYLILAKLLATALKDLHESEIGRLGLMTAALFVASQLHIPFGGGSAHLLLNSLAGVLLLHRAPIAITIAVVMQTLLFTHGGLTTIGVNVCVMSLPALGVAYLFPRLLRHTKLSGFVLGTLLGSIATLVTVLLNAAVLWFGSTVDTTRVVQLVLLFHVPIIGIEGVMTGLLMAYLQKVKPEWLPEKEKPPQSCDGSGEQQNPRQLPSSSD